MNTIPNARSYRIENIDMVRGLVIGIMALDHVRDYFMVAAEQDPTANPDIGAAVFTTRLITHICAPVFVFLVLRAIDVYGDPNPLQLQGSAISTVIDFLNVTKYPPSLLFLLMTLGPAAVICAFANRMPGAVKRPLIIFGRVPFAF